MRNTTTTDLVTALESIEIIHIKYQTASPASLTVLLTSLTLFLSYKSS